jgi:anti-sigma B factor antagonist
MKLVVDGDTIRIEEIQELGAENCQAFRDRVYSALPLECRNIVVDLSRTDYVDSCGLGALISLRKMASSRKGKVRLLNPTPRVQLLFEVTRMHRLFEIVNRTQVVASDGRAPGMQWAEGGVQAGA